MTYESANRFARHGETVTRSFGGDTVVVPIVGGVTDLDSVYVFGDVGALIWQLLDEGATIGEIVTAVVREYDVTPSEAERDATTFLESLLECHLIRRIDEAR